MSVKGVSTPVDIAASGLRAESLRMKAIANNIANATSSRTPTGKPYRRQQVVLSSEGDLSGVGEPTVVADLSSDFKRLLLPGHPDADREGFVLMPNVNLPMEMMSLVTASRAYQANAAVLKRYQEMVDVTLELLR